MVETKAHTLLVSDVSLSAGHGSSFQEQEKQVLDLSQVRNDHATVWVFLLLNKSHLGTALLGCHRMLHQGGAGFFSSLSLPGRYPQRNYFIQLWAFNPQETGRSLTHHLLFGITKQC